MKKYIIGLSALALISSCNNNTEKQEKTSVQTEKSVQNDDTTEVANDLSAFGMKEDSNPKGLEVGDQVPAISMTTSQSEKVALKDLYSAQPLVVIFYRGYWCPACNKHLSEFAKRAEEIEEAGAKIIAISPESYGKAEITIENTGVNFMVISDVDGSVMEAFDVEFGVTEEYQAKVEDGYNTTISGTNENNSAVLPVPATFIIDTTGMVVYKQFNPDYKERASIDEILENLPKAQNN